MARGGVHVSLARCVLRVPSMPCHGDRTAVQTETSRWLCPHRPITLRFYITYAWSQRYPRGLRGEVDVGGEASGGEGYHEAPPSLSDGMHGRLQGMDPRGFL